MSKSIYILALLFSFAAFPLFSQGWELELKSNVEIRTWKLTTKADEDVRALSGATIKLLKGTTIVKQTTSDGNGDFTIMVPPGGNFILEVSYPGCNAKRAAVNTLNVPDFGEEIFKPSFGIGGFIMCKPFPGIDYTGLQQPMVKIAYSPKIKNFDDDEAYTQQSLGVVGNISNAEQVLIDRFCSTNKSGDEALKKPDCPLAKTLYEKAMTIIPGESYPVQQLVKVGECLKAKEQEEQKAKEAAAKAEADKLAKQKAEEEKAQKAKEEAAAKAEAERLAKQKAEEEKAQKAKDDAAKAEADKIAKAAKETELKAQKDKEAATKAEADKIAKQKADEEKAQKAKDAAAKAEADKIAKAEKDAALKAEKEKAAAAKAEADKLAKQKADEEKQKKNQTAAQTTVTTNTVATTPTTTTAPKDKNGITVISTGTPKESNTKTKSGSANYTVRQELGSGKYKAAIQKGDGLMANKQYAEAKAAYQEALKLKPKDEYATMRIAEVEKLLKQ